MATLTAAPAPTAGASSVQQTEIYEVKRIEFLGSKKPCPVLLQSKNGPCPLLAIANQLLLSNKLVLPEHQEDMSLDNLVHLVAEKLIDSNSADESSINAENRRKAVADAIEILPTLAKGLDVNVQFAGVDKFEFDKNINVFDMLGVNLYHGWVIDPLDEAYNSLINLAYNTLVERVVLFDAKFGHDENAVAASMDDPELRTIAAQGEVATRFLNQHASQLTYTGLTKLHEAVKERELCVFFRNNHFSTMFKYEGHLYLLCTDSSFKSRNAVAWERLTDINGDTELCSPTFGDPNAYLSAEDVLHDLDVDEALARQLQIEENATRGSEPVGDVGNKAAPVVSPYPDLLMSTDEVLARQLQLQEDNDARMRQQQQRVPQQPQPQQTSSKSKSSICRIC